MLIIFALMEDNGVEMTMVVRWMDEWIEGSMDGLMNGLMNERI